MDQFNLHPLWATEIDILQHIDKFCRVHHLRYSLAYGTLIGAVRHGGFIPWDDDVDIVMPREDYEYLIRNWDVPGYILQNKETNDDFNQNFTKIRKDHSTFIQFEFEKKMSYHKGVFVDIFPGDRVAPRRISRTIQFIYCAINLLYSREGVVSKKQTLVERALLLIPHKWRLLICKWSEKGIQKWHAYDTEYFFPNTIRDAKIHYPGNIFENMTEIAFSSNNYMCIKDHDAFLTPCYGDYMQLPPENQQVYTHHPILVDYEKNYEEIIGEN